VRVLRLVTATPIEEKILATANEKLDHEAKVIEAGRFNQTSNASERKEMLQRLIMQSVNDDDEEESNITTDEDINEMLARSNPEFGMTREDEVLRYNEMDAEREAATRESRLLTEEGLPEWIRHAEELLNARKAAELGPKVEVDMAPRERKTAGYKDELSERDWSRMLESGMEREEFVASEAERKRKLEERRQRAAEAEEDEEPSPPDLGSVPPRKRGKKEAEHQASAAAAGAAVAMAAAALSSHLIASVAPVKTSPSESSVSRATYVERRFCSALGSSSYLRSASSCSLFSICRLAPMKVTP